MRTYKQVALDRFNATQGKAMTRIDCFVEGWEACKCAIREELMAEVNENDITTEQDVRKLMEALN